MRKILALVFSLSLLTFMSCTRDKVKETINQSTNYSVSKNITADSNVYGIEIEINKKIKKEDLLINNKLMNVVVTKENKTYIGLVSSDSNIKEGELLLETKDGSEVEYRITKKITELGTSASRNTVEMDNIYNLLGDFNVSGEVDIHDFSTFAESYGKSLGEVGYVSSYELYPARKGTSFGYNDIFVEKTGSIDNTIDIFDFYIFAQNFGKRIPINVSVTSTKLNVNLGVSAIDNNGKNIKSVVIEWGDSGTSELTENFEANSVSHDYALEGRYEVNIKSINEDDEIVDRKIILNLVNQEVVIFPDSKFNTLVRNMLGKSENDPIYPTDLDDLFDVNLMELQIESIAGFDKARKLNELYLDRNLISDLSYLKDSVSLYRLGLSGNLINNNDFGVKNLANLVNLDRLWIHNNPDIRDISSLSTLINLTDFNAENIGISDISALVNMSKLTKLNLSNNSINSIESLAGKISIENLKLNNNFISDISLLSGLTGLKTLYINNNDITSLEAIKDLNLTYLNVKGNSLLNLVEGTPDRAIIESFKARGTTVEYDEPSVVVEGISFNDSALEARIRNVINKPTGSILKSDVETIEELDLSEDMSGERIYSIKGLENFTALKSLNLQGNRIIDLEPLKNLSNLVVLNLNDNININFVDDILGLNLTDLYLNNTSLRSLDGMEGLTDLKNLYIKNTQNLIIRDGNGEHQMLQALINRGVTVDYDLSPLVEVNFNDIDLELKVRELIGKAMGVQIYEEDLNAITYLDISDLNIVDLTGLRHFKNLTRLIMKDNILVDNLDELSGLTKLAELNISGTSPIYLNALSSLGSLEILNISYTPIQTLYDIKNLNNLKTLYMYGVDTLDLTEGSEEYIIIEKLRENGCQVYY